MGHRVDDEIDAHLVGAGRLDAVPLPGAPSHHPQLNIGYLYDLSDLINRKILLSVGFRPSDRWQPWPLPPIV